MFSFHSLTDCMIGSIFYFTTGLHGMHVLMGLVYFYLILLCYLVKGHGSSYLLTFNPISYYSSDLLLILISAIHN